MIGYYRVLVEVQCNSCGHKCYDADAEEYNIQDEGNGYQIATIRMICPKCGKQDDMKSLNLGNTEGVSDGDAKESCVSHDVSLATRSGEDQEHLEPSVEGALASTTHDGNFYCDKSSEAAMNQEYYPRCDKQCDKCKEMKS